MGYTTEFDGQFNLDRPLEIHQIEYLKKFSQTRRMLRDPVKCETMLDPYRKAVGLPIGIDGEYFVGASGFAGQVRDGSILDYNEPPSTQPGLWCQWIPSEDGIAIIWDGGEKFYNYVEWLEYIIKNFLEPWGYKVNGEVKWTGEEPYDLGIIRVTDNVVEVLEAEITYKVKNAKTIY